MCDSKNNETAIDQDSGGQEKVNNIQEPKKKGRALLYYDLKLKQLIPIKVLFFVIQASKY